MNEQERSEIFSQTLDAGLAGSPPSSGQLPPEDQSLLQLAHHLVQADFSADSQIRLSLREKLVQQAAAQPHTPPRKRSLFHRSEWGQFTAWACVAVVLVVALGLALSNAASRPVAQTPGYTSTLLSSPFPYASATPTPLVTAGINLPALEPVLQPVAPPQAPNSANDHILPIGSTETSVPDSAKSTTP